MPEEFDVRPEPPRKGVGGRRPVDPYAVEFAEKCRKSPGSWVKFAPNGENFEAHHLATSMRERIYRGGQPWGDDRWEATTRKVKSGEVGPDGEYRVRPAWELWVSYQGPREDLEPVADRAAGASEADPEQPAFPFDRY